MRPGSWIPAVLLLASMAVPVGAQSPAQTEVNDLEAARALFERNLDAIRNHDTEAYLACYWPNERFTRNGNQGPVTGYADWAQSLGEGWPEVFEAEDMHLTWITAGVVYGSYRYHVVIEGAESTGISERVFLRTDEGWRIAVSTAFENPEPTEP